MPAPTKLWFAEWPLAEVVIGDVQFLPGCCLLLPDPVVPSLNDLSEQARATFLLDMARVGDAILRSLVQRESTMRSSATRSQSCMRTSFLGTTTSPRRNGACRCGSTTGRLRRGTRSTNTESYMRNFAACSWQAANPSVERTHNGGRRLLAPSPSAAPLRAAHVKR